MPLRGGEPRLLTDGPDDEQPDWSKDGSRIVYNAGFGQINTVDVATQRIDVLFECRVSCVAVQDPSWSPDGREVAFVIAETADGETTSRGAIMAVDLATRQVRTILEDTSGAVWFFAPRWSPDGKRLVAEADTFASNRLDEGTVVRSDIVTAQSSGAGWPHVIGTGQSPDWGARNCIVYSVDGNLRVVAPDGSGARDITTFDGVTEHAIQPTFTADGSHIVFTHVRGTFGVDDRPSAAWVGTRGGAVTDLADGMHMTHPRLRVVLG